MKTILPLIVWMVAGTAALYAQQDGQLNVGVRTQLDRQKNTQNGKAWDGTKLHELPPAPDHGKVYGILLFQQAQEIYGKLVKPVDVAALKAELIRQMDSHGFTHAGPKRRPDILLTIIYGRGYLPNPYYTHDTNVDNMNFQTLNLADDGTYATLVDDPQIAARLKVAGVRDNARKATLEKLFILVRAWKNPASPKEKPEVLWVATMLVDDPDHRDLNVIARQMLEAGAPFFDKEIKNEEVEIMKPVPDGRVNVGAPTVVDSAKAN